MIVRSIDSPRERSVSRHYRGLDLAGQVIEREFVGVTLVVAIKEDCLGCRSVFESGIDAFGEVDTLLVAARPSLEPWWTTTQHPVIISPQLLRDLEVRSPPFYVLVDPDRELVVTEGVVFGPEQVRDELAPYLM